MIDFRLKMRIDRGLLGVVSVVAVGVAGVVFLVPRQAAATTVTLGPGQLLTLDQDLTLTDMDVLDAEGTADTPCTIEGQGHSVITDSTWQGTMVVRFCTLHGLGQARIPAFTVLANGAAQVTFEGDTFDASGQLAVSSFDSSSLQVLRNTVLDSSLVDVLMDSAENSIDAMLFQGYTSTPKVFQGNRIFRSSASFVSVQYWTIGGPNPGDGNVIIGSRGGINVQGNNIEVEGNYVRFTGDLDGWNQVKEMVVVGDAVTVEHNVMRDGNWLVDVLGGAEIRYNLFGDSHDRPWLILEEEDGVQLIHHNVFMRNDPTTHVAGIWVLRPQSSSPAEIYNNTFYGGGKCWSQALSALSVYPGGFLDSLRSNAFLDFPINFGAQTAILRGTDEPVEPIDPPPARLGYADYNLFWNPEAAARDNYGLSVTGKQERVDPGFALNDTPVGGKINDQVDPLLAGEGMIPVQFPYSDDDIKAGTVTVCQILAFYRTLFAPVTGSPLIGAGDPADGAGNNIGAIGGPDDNFGMLCASGDIGSPNLAPAVYTCPKPPPPSPDAGTTNPPLTGGNGFVCVCDAASSSPPAPLVVSALVLAGLIVRRRASRRAVAARSRRRPSR